MLLQKRPLLQKKRVSLLIKEADLKLITSIDLTLLALDITTKPSDANLIMVTQVDSCKERLGLEAVFF